ncbi:hypothetical protein OROMI_002575 [Orobanche minor]
MVGKVRCNSPPSSSNPNHGRRTYSLYFIFHFQDSSNYYKYPTNQHRSRTKPKEHVHKEVFFSSAVVSLIVFT